MMCFNIYKAEDMILWENISNTLKITQKYFSPVQHKRIACLLTDKISLDRAVELTGINSYCISKYRCLKNKNGDNIFTKLKDKRINENYKSVLNSWGEVNVVVISRKPSFEWFKKQVKERRWLRSNYDRYYYRCSICYLGKEAAKLKLQHNKGDDDMMIVTDKNGLVNEKKNRWCIKGRRRTYRNS